MQHPEQDGGPSLDTGAAGTVTNAPVANSGAGLAQHLIAHHVETLNAIPKEIATRLMRRASDVNVRLSLPPIRRLQRMIATDANSLHTSLPLLRVAANSTESAFQGTILPLSVVGGSGAEAGGDPSQSMVSSSTFVQPLSLERQAAVQVPNTGVEPPRPASVSNLGTAILHRHVSEPAERTIHRQVVTQEPPYVRAHRVLPHQPGPLLAQRALGAASITPVVSARPTDAPPASLPSASPGAATIQRQVADLVPTPPARKDPADETSLPVALGAERIVREPSAMPASPVPAATTMQRQALAGVAAEPIARQLSTDEMAPPFIPGAEWIARRPISMPADPLSASPAFTTIQRQIVASVAPEPMVLPPALGKTTLPITAGVEQPAHTASSRTIVRVDRVGLADPATMLLARTVAQGKNESLSSGATVRITPDRLRLSRMAEPGGRDRPALSVSLSARPVDVSSAHTPLVLSRVSASATSMIAQQETASALSAAAPPAGEPTAASPAPSPAATPGADAGQALDPDELVEKTLHRLMRHLAVEGERRGWTRWP